MSFHYPTITIFACKAGYRSNDLVNFRELPDGSAVAVIPTGQKFTYSAQELQDFELVMIAQDKDLSLILAAKQLETRVPPAGHHSVIKGKAKK